MTFFVLLFSIVFALARLPSDTSSRLCTACALDYSPWPLVAGCGLAALALVRLYWLVFNLIAAALVCGS